MNHTDIAIVSGARTPMGRYCGKLRDFSAQELAAVAATEAIKRSGVEPAEFDHAIFGMRWCVGLGEGKLEDTLMVALLDTYCGLQKANTAELYAEQQGIMREQMDEFAL